MDAHLEQRVPHAFPEETPNLELDPCSSFQSSDFRSGGLARSPPYPYDFTKKSKIKPEVSPQRHRTQEPSFPERSQLPHTARAWSVRNERAPASPAGEGDGGSCDRPSAPTPRAPLQAPPRFQIPRSPRADSRRAPCWQEPDLVSPSRSLAGAGMEAKNSSGAINKKPALFFFFSFDTHTHGVFAHQLLPLFTLGKPSRGGGIIFRRRNGVILARR